MKHSIAGYSIWVFGALFSLSVAPGAWAGSVPKLVQDCTYCHGKGGASAEPSVPIIGGFSSDYLISSLTALKRQERHCPETEYPSGPRKGTKTDMCQLVKNLSSNDIKEVARYYAAQKFVRAKQKFDPELARKGKEIHDRRCEKCHSGGATIPTDDAGIQAGQHMPYLEQVLFEFISGTRPVPKKMKAQLDELDKAGLEALIHYYGSFQ